MRLLILFVILFSLKGFAATLDTQADLERFQSQQQSLENDPDNPLYSAYQVAIQQLQDVLLLEQQAQNIRSEIATQAQQLEQARTAAAPIELTLPDHALTEEELQQLLVKNKTKLIDLEKNHNDLQQIIRDSDTLLLSKRTKLATLQQQLNDLTTDAETQPSTDLQQLRAQTRQYQQREIALRLEITELEIVALPGQVELANLKLTNLQKQIQSYDNWINAAEQHQQQVDRAAAEKALSQVEHSDTDSNPILQQALTRNSETANIIRQALAETEQIAQRRKQLEQQLQIIRQTYQAIRAQLELDVSYTGSEIRKHIQQLPKPLKPESSKSRLKALRLSQLTLSLPIVQQTEIDSLSEAQQNKFNQLHQSLAELISEQRSLQQKLISELSQLLLIQEQFNQQIIDSRTLFNKHLLWLPSTTPLSLQWPNQVGQGFILLIDEIPRLLQPYLSQLSNTLALPLGLLIITLPLALFCRRYLNNRQPQWCQLIGNVSQDNIRHTLRPLLYGPLIALPIPLSLYALGRQFDEDAASMSNLLYLLAFISWLYLTFMRWLQQPYGLLQGQFSLPEQTTQTLRQRLHLLFWTNTPLIALLFILDLSNHELIIAGPTRLILLIITLGFTLFWISLWRSIPQSQAPDPSRLWHNAGLWIGFIIAFNMAMAGLVIWGYMLSASILTGLMLLLVCIAILAYLMFHLGRRWLLIEERRLYFNRALARRADILSAREEQKDTPPIKENFIDIQTISEQGNMLLKTVTALMFITLAWFTLGWTLPALDMLDSVTLWSTSSSDNGILSFITLKQIIFALAALTITFIAARNLPGLFELLVLNYLPLAPGTGFAISTLLKYSLYIIGLISFLNFLGLEWGKLQWLIAAMGVGLGFGLQEIVANFVSGLIILFEKPIRIGDTITIGGVTGNVSRIHIRATTITDWDRKEVIIPNKTFITDQLINWSLTDPITRIIVPVGVAYGSDTGLVTELLLQAAAVNKNVLTEPAPLAYFLSFGNSTLDFELRAYISSMDKRNQATHDLHRTIDQLFKEHDIEIAFPQLDLHVRTNDGAKQTDQNEQK
ncbi:mechanosensitive ion channel [Amphritea sp. 1_MG-2023]|uniref:mechanosensitive ion channel domain-containing protein n=1 Tax=Amphritea sp. 1_MG-2023 TaxID=3062670 RepID=UPI0026E35FA0|nr:mechanosensitive ion channel domain-containing protein [Amphritea sp. 1_MG-2023]MDO6563016.1 mechanosensitive ion channel [Amphritea sp. 1_MG-2023]